MSVDVMSALDTFAKQTSTEAVYSFAKMIALHVVKDNPLKDLMQAGNIKIPKTTAIFNMSSATDCPSLKLDICKACVADKNFCYALKSERSYRPNVLPYRRRQQEYWLTTTAEQFAFEFLLVNSLKPVPYTKLRLNEAGDFHSQACIYKADKIARILSNYGVDTYCYTSRSDLDFSKIKYMTVNGSGFKTKGIQNEFRMIMKDEPWPKGYAKCPMDCTVCDRCSKKGKDTFVIQH
ncbi:MAG TPA: hypothetical protein VMW91_03385 [Desulfosporosinus sp.]|nr:hypothetical protein [Desulfosporosinus sp.]